MTSPTRQKAPNGSRILLFVVGYVLLNVLIAWVEWEPGVEARIGPGVHSILSANLKYVGNAGCAGSDCHSADKATEQSGQLIGDELDIWSESDPHAHAYASLGNADSKKIATALGIDSAAKSSRCLTCHAMDVPAGQRGELFALKDAVGCESCHGPAEKWLEPHKKTGWTSKERTGIGAKGMWEKYGLADTSNLGVRANTCVACHLQIGKDMIDAGHPPLEFELYAYSYYVSKKDKEFATHWDDSRHGKMIDARLWATGQAAALAAAQAQVAAWKKKQWDTAEPEAMAKLYGAGVAIAKKHFGAETADKLAEVEITPAKAAAAAGALAELGATADNKMRRRIVGFGVAALGSSTFTGRDKDVPDSFWEAYEAATSGKGGDAYTAALKKMASLAK
ncbi:MAG: cytochrome c family protein, partial [Phycisphaerae bacterium]|nr:cytochrome c family protein [Phycisphaerae bacterium]